MLNKSQSEFNEKKRFKKTEKKYLDKVFKYSILYKQIKKMDFENY